MIPSGQIDTPEKRQRWENYLARYYRDRRWAIENHLKIRTKDQRLIKLKLNEAQDRLYGIVEQQEAAGVPVRVIGVKPRKVGLSTGIQALFFHRASTHKLQKGLTVAHDMDSTEEMFQMTDLFYGELPEQLRPMKRYGGRGELVFENPDEESRQVRPGLRSQLKIGTAGKIDLGRSKDIHLLHCSESPYWPDAEKTELALLNAVPDLPSTMVFKEGTPNGVGTKFYRDYEDAKASRTAYAPYFMAWWEFREYQMPFVMRPEAFEDSLEPEEHKLRKAYNLTLDQLNWRRWAIANKCGGDQNQFEQEYPANDVDCADRDTRVGTSHGYVKICDVKIGAMSDHGRVLAKKNKGELPVWRLTTKRGYTIRVTPEHLFAIDDDVFEKCESMARKPVQLQVPRLAEAINVEQWIGFGGVSRSLPIDKRWGAFLGYFMGDGSFGGKQLSMVSDGRDEDVTARNVDLITDIFGVVPTVRRVGTNGGGREVRVQTKQFCEIFGHLGIVTNPVRGAGASKRIVCVPECIWRSPRSVVREFVSNLFEADGWASRTRPVVKFFSKYLEFTRDIQRLLLAFGVLSTIRKVVRKTNGKEFPGNELTLNAREAILFMREIGFVSARKRAGFAAHCAEPLIDRRCPESTMIDKVVLVEPDGTAEVWDIQIDGAPVFGAGGILIHNCFLVSGRPRFNAKKLHEMLLAAKDPTARGLLVPEGSLVKFQENPAGFVRIWKPPKLGKRYVIGADVAEGLIDGDFSCGHVYDWRTCEQVAEWHGHMEPDLFGVELGKLGKIYNEALIGVEANKDGATVNTRLKNDGYPHLFYRQDLDRRTNRKTAKLGWLTTTATKPVMIDTLAASIVDGSAGIPSRETISEMMTFVYHDDGSLGAQSGCFDDRVVASAIALEVRKRHGLESFYPGINRQ